MMEKGIDFWLFIFILRNEEERLNSYDDNFQVKWGWWVEGVW